jgi:hypothetical protein
MLMAGVVRTHLLLLVLVLLVRRLPGEVVVLVLTPTVPRIAILRIYASVY